MSKNKAKAARRSQSAAQAWRSRWLRSIGEKPALLKELIDIRAKYFPSGSIEPGMYTSDYGVIDECWEEVCECAERHGIGTEFLISFVLYGFPDNEPLANTAYVAADESQGHEIRIPLRYSLISQMFELLELQLQNTPPQPQPMRNNPRKMDWRPVWEWSKLHPDITYKQIAAVLGYNPVTVTRRMEECEAEYGDTGK